VLTNVGAHGQLQGLGAHWELWMFVQGGMSEMDAIRSATINPALSLGLAEDLGSIEEGKLADILVLNGNPLEDIHESESIGLVMANGRLFDGMTLFETGNYSSPRPTLWFERTRPMTPGGGVPQ
jgi:imidazolonepropionase-like amidohydrolase